MIQKKSFDTIRIKNDLFISRAGREVELCLYHKKLLRFVLCYLYFNCLLPLFATPSPTLSKNYELCKSIRRNLFLARDQAKAGDTNGQVGPIMPARIAN